MKYHICLDQQSIVRDIDGDPEQVHIPLRALNYRAIPVPSWSPGQAVVVDGNDLGHYVGPTEDGKRAVIQWPAGHPRYTDHAWDEVEPYDMDAEPTPTNGYPRSMTNEN